MLFFLCFLVSVLSVSLIFAGEWDLSTTTKFVLFVFWLAACICLGIYGRRY